MTVGEFREIAKAMQEFDIDHVKLDGCEMTRNSHLKHNAWHMDKKDHAIPQDVTTDPSDPIKHNVEQMASLLKLSDTELVDPLFPDKSEEVI